MYLLSGRAGRENIWPEIMAYGPSVARSVRHDLTQSISILLNDHRAFPFSFFFRVTKFGMFLDFLNTFALKARGRTGHKIKYRMRHLKSTKKS